MARERPIFQGPGRRNGLLPKTAEFIDYTPEIAVFMENLAWIFVLQFFLCI
jgi:hypothetical protein